MHFLSSSLLLTIMLQLTALMAPLAGDDAVSAECSASYAIEASTSSPPTVRSKPAGGRVFIASSAPEAGVAPESSAPASDEGEAQGSEAARASDGPPEPKDEPLAEEDAAATTGAVSDEARPLVEKVQSFYEDTGDFTAIFRQTYTYQVGREVESRGTVSFKKPAMMRWDYEQPRERMFLVDGSDLWIWTPEDYTVMRQRGFTASDLSTSITFLWGEGRLEDEFHIELEGDDGLSLTPIRPEGAFRRVVFRIDPETGRVLETTVIDPQGNRNHMVFTEVKLNTGIGKERFVFTPPAGADLQEMPELP